jgi:hypothetical protein
VPHEADNVKLDIVLLDQANDRFHNMPGHNMNLDGHASHRSVGACGGDDRSKPMVSLRFSSSISSIVAGKRGSSSTVMMCNSAPVIRAIASAAGSAFCALEEPSSARRIP